MENESQRQSRSKALRQGRPVGGFLIQSTAPGFFLMFSQVPEAQSYSLIQHDLIHSIPATMAERREPRVTSELIAWGRGSLGLGSVGLDHASVRIHRLSFHICGTCSLIYKTPFGMRSTLWVT